MKQLNLWSKGMYLMAALILAQPMALQAAYNPKLAEVSGEFNNQVKQIVRELKSMPKLVRQCIIAEDLGLLYTESGLKAYEVNKVDVGWYWAGAQALYIGPDGKPRRMAYDKKACKIDWLTFRQKLKDIGHEFVLSPFSKEVTRIVCVNAKYHLKSMPYVLRDYFLAKESMLLYMADESDPYLGEQTFVNEAKKSIPYIKVDSHALFVDAKGETHSVEEIEKYQKEWGQRLNILQTCCFLVGSQDILNLFADEVKALKRQRSAAKTKEKAANEADEAEDSAL